jgi:hypothetical protein
VAQSDHNLKSKGTFIGGTKQMKAFYIFFLLVGPGACSDAPTPGRTVFLAVYWTKKSFLIVDSLSNFLLLQQHLEKFVKDSFELCNSFSAVAKQEKILLLQV